MAEARPPAPASPMAEEATGVEVEEEEALAVTLEADLEEVLEEASPLEEEEDTLAEEAHVVVDKYVTLTAAASRPR